MARVPTQEWSNEALDMMRQARAQLNIVQPVVARGGALEREKLVDAAAWLIQLGGTLLDVVPGYSDAASLAMSSSTSVYKKKHALRNRSRK